MTTLGIGCMFALAQDVAKKYRVEPSELIAAGWVREREAETRYDPRKNPSKKSFLWRTCRWAMVDEALTITNRNHKHKDEKGKQVRWCNTVPMEAAPLPAAHPSPDHLEQREMMDRVMRIAAFYKAEEIFRLLLQGLELPKIATSLNIPYTTAHRRYTSTVDHVREAMKEPA